MTAVYLDTVFFYNALADYLLLLAAGRLMGLPLRRRRFFLAALLGGAYAAAVFLPGCGFLSAGAAKLLPAAAMVRLAYGGGGRFLRRYLVFLLVSGGFAGVEMALAGFAGSGAVPFSLPLFFMTFALCYLLLGVVFRGSGRSAERRQLLEVTVERGGRRVTLTALADSGSTLSDPATGEAVLIAERSALRGLFTSEEAQALAEGRSLSELPLLTLPFHSLGGGGSLAAFRADRATVAGRTYEDALVAAAEDGAAGNGTFQGLWGGETERRRTDEISCLAERLAQAVGAAAGGAGDVHRRQRHTAAAADEGGGGGAALPAEGGGPFGPPDPR